MRTTSGRLVTATAAMLVVMLAIATTAFAAVHITDRPAASGDMSISLESTGDAGQLHGNANPVTSPVDGSGTFYWFNQDVRVFAFAIADTIDADGDILQTGGQYRVNTGAGYGAWVPFAGEPVFSGEGVYGVVGTGLDALTSGPATGTIEPAFGIDKTPPATSSDATLAYVNGSATINIAATDEMSGVQDVRTSLDGGPWDYTYDGAPGQTDVSVTTLVPGAHTLVWSAFDNAGNVDTRMVNFVVYIGDTVTIGASAGANGQISPSGSVAVTVNTDAPFAITPASHYHVAGVTVDGVPVGPVTQYTFPHVTEAHTIAASFAIDTRNITASAGANGSISPAGVTAVNYGAGVTYAIIPYAGYRVADVLVDGSSVGAVTNYSFTSVTGAHTISASFVPAAPMPFTPSVSLGIGYASRNHRSVTLSGNISEMAAATTLKFTIQRKNGRKWSKYSSFTRTQPALAPTYSYGASVKKSGTYRVQASDSGGSSSWVSFKAK